MRHMHSHLSRALLAAAVGLALAGCTDADAKDAAPAAQAAAIDPAHKADITLPVEGMVCEGCSSAIKEKVEKLPGVVSCTADHEKKSASITFDKSKVNPAQMIAAIRDLGYKSAMPGETPVGAPDDAPAAQAKPAPQAKPAAH